MFDLTLHMTIAVPQGKTRYRMKPRQHRTSLLLLFL
jgi:hypothetical protein